MEEVNSDKEKFESELNNEIRKYVKESGLTTLDVLRVYIGGFTVMMKVFAHYKNKFNITPEELRDVIDNNEYVRAINFCGVMALKVSGLDDKDLKEAVKEAKEKYGKDFDL